MRPIVFVHSNLGLGGAEALREMVCRELEARGVAFRVCVTSDAPEQVVRWEGLRHRLDFLQRPRQFWRADTTLALARYLRTHRPKIVQSGQFLSNWHTRWAAPPDAAIVSEEHGFNDWMRPHHRRLDRLAARRADVILAVSNAVGEHVAAQLGPACPPIEVLLNPVPAGLVALPSVREQARRQLGLGPGLVIGTVGTLRREKGHDILLQALARLADLEPTLLVVGDGPLAQSLAASSRALGVDRLVRWHGRDPDCLPLLDAMDIFAFPSRSEGLGIAILEAMARGLPVVAARTGGIPEVVQDGVTGRLVPPESADALAQALRALWLAPLERQRLGAAARDHVRSRHDLGRYVDALLQLHAGLGSNAGDPRAGTATRTSEP